MIKEWNCQSGFRSGREYYEFFWKVKVEVEVERGEEHTRAHTDIAVRGCFAAQGCGEKCGERLRGAKEW